MLELKFSKQVVELAYRQFIVPIKTSTGLRIYAVKEDFNYTPRAPWSILKQVTDTVLNTKICRNQVTISHHYRVASVSTASQLGRQIDIGALPELCPQL